METTNIVALLAFAVTCLTVASAHLAQRNATGRLEMRVKELEDRLAAALDRERALERQMRELMSENLDMRRREERLEARLEAMDGHLRHAEKKSEEG